MRSRFLSIVFWSVISAAFIGPGTVTTAAAAGAEFGMQIVWALVFSTLGCMILQEAAARITISTGYSFGEALSMIYPGNHGVRWLLFIAILTGGAAYQAGNILGAVSGLHLQWSLNRIAASLILVVLGSLLLWFGKIKAVANTMGVIVAVMGFSFIMISFTMDINWMEGIKVRIPQNSELLVIGLIGTTIVPYNLFLASGLSHGQDLSTMRWGLIPAIGIGGIISIAIMTVGTSIIGDFSFQALSNALSKESGSWAGFLLGLGLFAAGFTSSITAPLATAVTARTLFGNNWNEGSLPYRLSWILVMLSGLIFGISRIKPIPVIILAQAFNGFLLPGITLFLILVLNHPAVVKKPNSVVNNFLLSLILLITLFLGLNNILKIFMPDPDPTYFSIISILSILVTGLVILRIFHLRASFNGLK